MLKAVKDFFTSIKVAIVLLIILIGASILGTLIPQGRSAQEYLARYGQMGSLFQKLQFTRLYQSFCYIAVLALFGLNIIVCTLVRLGPKLRRVFQPRCDLDARSIQVLNVKDRVKMALAPAAAAQAVKAELGRHHYRVREHTAPNKHCLLARKRVLGLFGSDVVHTGLLIILAGGIISGLAGQRGSLSLSENQTVPVPGAGFSVRLDKFITELYPDGNVKDWKSRLTVIEGSRELYQKMIEVNHPLNHRGFVFYQSGYGWDWENPTLEVWLKKKSDPDYLKKLSLQVGQTAGVEGEDITLTAARFLPDFVLDEKYQPQTRSFEPRNPAALIRGERNGTEVFSGWIFAKFPDFAQMHQAEETEFKPELKDVQAPQYSVLQTAKDPGVSLIWVGCAALMFGLFLAFYWPPREIRIVLEESQGRTELSAGGIAVKSREAFQSEFDTIMKILRKTK
ncbi:MAG: cytochrome c biogenesis protein ResB [Candidatus Aminicenantales bacterium]